MAFSSTVILGHTIFRLFIEIQTIKKQTFFYNHVGNILCRHTQTSRISVLISAMVTNSSEHKIIIYSCRNAWWESWMCFDWWHPECTASVFI